MNENLIIAVDGKLKSRLKNQCQKEARNMSAVVRILIEKYLDKPGMIK